MKWHRIWAIILRFLYLFRRSFDRMSDAFYWPTIDLLLWGLTSTYFMSMTANTGGFMTVIISGILFWLIVWRGQYEVTVNVLEEMWNKNLVNLFVSPLRFWEWVVSFLIIGVIKAFLSFMFALGVAFLLYKVNVFQFGFYLIPFGFLLIMTGWWVGFLVAGLILRFGSKIQTLAWSMIAVLSPFVGIYYPISVLPEWAQKISMMIPATYVFEGAREVLKSGVLDLNKIWISLGLNLVYLVLALWFFKASFSEVLKKGLVKVF